jgi:hypothetical protein
MPSFATAIWASSIERRVAPLRPLVRELEWVVQYFPEGDAKTYISLSLAYEAVHKRTAAESTLEKGKRLFPADQLLQKFSLKNN